MKILQVAPRYPPRNGGVERYVQHLARRLNSGGHEVTVLTADAGDDVPRWEVRNGIEIRRHKSLAPGGAFHLSPGVTAAVQQANVDAVHAHNYHSLPLLFAALGTGRTTFVATPHYHGTSAHAVRDRLLSAYRPVGRWALNRADAVVAVSDWERTRLGRDLGLDATLIRSGVAADRFVGVDPEPRARPYVLSVGRLEEYKGVQHAIRAMAELPAYDLLVAGSGPYRDELARVARETGVAERVDFLGYVDDDRLPNLYAGAEAYVTLSEVEAYGMTVGEALAAGTPCVVYEANALADWTDEPGVGGVDDRSPNAVADAVRKQADREVTWTPRTWDDAVEELLSVYGSVAAAETD